MERKICLEVAEKRLGNALQGMKSARTAKEFKRHMQRYDDTQSYICNYL